MVSPKSFPRWWRDADRELRIGSGGWAVAWSVLAPGARPRRGCGGWRSGQRFPGRRRLPHPCFRLAHWSSGRKGVGVNELRQFWGSFRGYDGMPAAGRRAGGGKWRWRGRGVSGLSGRVIPGVAGIDLQRLAVGCAQVHQLVGRHLHFAGGQDLVAVFAEGH